MIKNDSQLKKVLSEKYFSLNYQKMLCHLMQNQLLSIDAELEKDQFKGLEMRNLNDTEIVVHRFFFPSSKQI